MLKIELIQGDCLEKMKDISDKSVDMVLCDLPYGTTACKWDTIIPFEPLWEQYKRIIKDNGAIVLTASQPFTSALVMSNVKMFKYDFVWNKGNTTGFLNAKKMPLRKHEDILVFSDSKNGKFTYNPIMRKGVLRKKGRGVDSEQRVYSSCKSSVSVNDTYYPTLGNLIKCNPAIKTDADQKALFEALATKHIDIVATDHAPHTFEEKQQNYFQSPSGIPMVQHSLNMMLELSQKNNFPIESVVEKMCHNPAIIFSVQKRGFIGKGFYADIILVDTKSNYTVNKNNILYKCAWSPLEGIAFSSVVTHTFVNGNLIYENEIGRAHV